MLLLLAACQDERPPNLLLVSMDTVRYDHTSQGGARDTTPELKRLATRGASWSSAWSVGNESILSHAAILTGRYPSEVALPDYASFSLPESVPTLASVLAANGYHTGAFTGGGHVIAEFGFDHGFEVYETATGDTRAGSFQQTVPMAQAWIAAQADTPWFAFVHGYDAHSPYVQPGPYGHLFGRAGETPQVEQIVADPRAVEQLRGHTWYFERTAADFTHATGQRLLGLDVYTAPATPRPGERFATLTYAEIAHLRDHYDTGVAYGDAWLGLLLADLDLDHTVVIVLSDHGEDLLEHGFVNHRAGLWDSTTHVPLVAAGPGFDGLGPQAGTVDVRSVLPTLLQAAGAMLPAGVTAPPLQSLPDAPFVFAEGVMDQVSVRGPALRLTASGVGLPTGTMTLDAPAMAALYAEPAPEDVAATHPADVATLQDTLRTWRAALHPAQVPGAPVDPALRDALRKRGYWTPGEPTQAAPDTPAQ